MAILKPKPKPKLDANGAEIIEGHIYAAITSFCCGPAGQIVVREGANLRGNDPAVQTAPTLFLPQPVTDGELAQARHRVWPTAP